MEYVGDAHVHLPDSQRLVDECLEEIDGDRDARKDEPSENIAPLPVQDPYRHRHIHGPDDIGKKEKAIGSDGRGAAGIEVQPLHALAGLLDAEHERDGCKRLVFLLRYG